MHMYGIFFLLVRFQLFSPLISVRRYSKHTMGNTTYIDPESSSNSDELSPFHVISSSIPKIQNGPADLADLISCAKYHASNGERTIVQVNDKGAFIIWLGNVAERSAWTFEDGLSHATKFFDRGKESSTSFLFTD